MYKKIWMIIALGASIQTVQAFDSSEDFSIYNEPSFERSESGDAYWDRDPDNEASFVRDPFTDEEGGSTADTYSQGGQDSGQDSDQDSGQDSGQDSNQDSGQDSGQDSDQDSGSQQDDTLVLLRGLRKNFEGRAQNLLQSKERLKGFLKELYPSQSEEEVEAFLANAKPQEVVPLLHLYEAMKYYQAHGQHVPESMGFLKEAHQLCDERKSEIRAECSKALQEKEEVIRSLEVKNAHLVEENVQLKKNGMEIEGGEVDMA